MDGLSVLARLQGVVKLAVLSHDDNTWYSVVRRVRRAVTKAAAVYAAGFVGGSSSPVSGSARR